MEKLAPFFPDLGPGWTAHARLPDHAFPYPVAKVGTQLVVQIVCGAAARDLDNELRRTLDIVVVAQAGATARFGLDA